MASSSAHTSSAARDTSIAASPRASSAAKAKRAACACSALMSDRLYRGSSSGTQRAVSSYGAVGVESSGWRAAAAAAAAAAARRSAGSGNAAGPPLQRRLPGAQAARRIAKLSFTLIFRELSEPSSSRLCPPRAVLQPGRPAC